MQRSHRGCSYPQCGVREEWKGAHGDCAEAQVSYRDVILALCALYRLPSHSQYMKLMSFLPNWCISLIHLWLLVLPWDQAVFITDVCLGEQLVGVRCGMCGGGK